MTQDESANQRSAWAKCDWFFGSHGCDLPKNHEGDHGCYHGPDRSEFNDPDWWDILADEEDPLNQFMWWPRGHDWEFQL